MPCVLKLVYLIFVPAASFQGTNTKAPLSPVISAEASEVESDHSDMSGVPPLTGKGFEVRYGKEDDRKVLMAVHDARHKAIQCYW